MKTWQRRSPHVPEPGSPAFGQSESCQHHIEHWSTGGETSLENMMLLCKAHHVLVHEGGFRIEKDYQDRWIFKRPDGRAVPPSGYRAEDMTDDYAEVESEYLDTRPSAEGFLAWVKNLANAAGTSMPVSPSGTQRH